MMKQIYILSTIFILTFFLSCKQEQKSPSNSEVIIKKETTTTLSVNSMNFEFKVGDIVFQDSDCGPFCDAIEKVTKGIRGAKFSHVGMIVPNEKNQLVVIEAITKGVVETPIDTFLNRSFDADHQPKVVVGRLKTNYWDLIPTAVVFAKEQLGKSYDDIFDIQNDKYYCSELIYLAFEKANKGQPIFQLRTMTFKDPDTEKTFELWVDYFKKLDEAIPEGAPGLNPGSISRSSFIDIVHAFGKPTGWKGALVSLENN